MSDDRIDVGAPPLYIPCDPLSRTFPSGWKDVYFRRFARPDEDGVIRYACPLCDRRFDHRDIDYLQGDHIWPYSLFGESSWANYELICGNCNASKSNKLQTDFRRVLGNSAFRLMACRFLCKEIASGNLDDSRVLRRMLGSAGSDG
jgi:hypothetical protein